MISRVKSLIEGPLQSKKHKTDSGSNSWCLM